VIKFHKDIDMLTRHWRKEMKGDEGGRCVLRPNAGHDVRLNIICERSR
jgi:hypothetical protein